MKKQITLLFTILIVLGLCACSLEEIPKTSPVDEVAVVGKLSQPPDVIEVDKNVTLDTPEQDTSESDAASEPLVTDDADDTLPSDTVEEQEPSEKSATNEPPQPKLQETESPKDTEPQTEQISTAPSGETTPKIEPPAETAKPQEPEPPVRSEPEKPSAPKTAYDYEFDVDQIRKDLITLAKGYGLALDESLTPNNASWANPVFATKSTQGDLLKRLLNESVRYYADKDFRASMGLSDLGLMIFNIYCESLGNGEYRIYFLNY